MPYRMTPSVRHRAIEVHYYYYYIPYRLIFVEYLDCLEETLPMSSAVEKAGAKLIIIIT